MYKSLPPNKAFFVRRASSILESGQKKIEPTAQAYSNDDEQLLKKLRGPIFLGFKIQHIPQASFPQQVDKSLILFEIRL